jgi:hypothetical protein
VATGRYVALLSGMGASLTSASTRAGASPHRRDPAGFGAGQGLTFQLRAFVSRQVEDAVIASELPGDPAFPSPSAQPHNVAFTL